MEQLSLGNIALKGRLPFLNIKENTVLQSNLYKNKPSYLSNDILINLQKCKDSSHTPHEGKVSNVWSSPKRREKFKHISLNPICVCGAGNDFTFLYDKSIDQWNESKSDPVVDKVRRKTKKIDDKTLMKIPEKIFPAEFTLSTHHGSKPIELYDEKYSTKPISHNSHKICLPLMNPNLTLNASKIYHSIVDILQKSGLNDSTDYILSTSLHKLLVFVKKEQDIYNIVFHGIIKETTVECIERGELLSNIRQRYRNIFVKVPEIIKDFHDKVVARRILDRRLTEELIRFQNTVWLLSSELSGIKDHEDNINSMCQRAKHQLKDAVEETKTYADLLREYHDLYEQQRQRLQNAVMQLGTERDCWRTAAYKITELVLDHYDIKPGITLVASEHNLLVLSQHFVKLLTFSDNEALTIIKTKTNLFCNEAQKFSLMLAIREDNLKFFLNRKIEKITLLKEEFEDEYLNEQGQLMEPIGKEITQKILNLIIGWEKSLSEISEIFGGQSMLIEEEKLKHMKEICSEYTDVAVEVFNRHRNESDGSLYQEHLVLFEINKMIDKMIDQFMDQLTGDNGVADGIITLQTYLENWITRLSNCVTELYFRPMPDTDWIRFKLLLDDWISLLNESKLAIGTTKLKINPIDGIPFKKLEIHEIIQSVDNWSHKSSSGIESENLKLNEAIVNLNRNMVRWTSQVVLRLAPDFPSNSPEARRAARLASAGIKELQENSLILHDGLNKITNYVISCSKDIVARLSQIKLDTQSEFPDSDNLKLQQLTIYSKSWIGNSQEVLKEIIEIEFASQNKNINTPETLQVPSDFLPERSLTIDDDSSPRTADNFDVKNIVGQLIDNVWSNDVDDEENIVEIPRSPPSVEGVGMDYNVHSKMLLQDPEKPYVGNKFQNINSLDISADLPQTKEAFQLIQIFEILQRNLRSRNSEVYLMENNCTTEELEVAKSKSYLDTLKSTMVNLSKELEQMQTERSQILPTPALFSSTNTIERAISQSTERSTTPKSVTSSKRRAPRHSKKNLKK